MEPYTTEARSALLINVGRLVFILVVVLGILSFVARRKGKTLSSLLFSDARGLKIALVVIVGAFGFWVYTHTVSIRPSESDGRAAIEQKIQRESKGLIRLVSFNKTDGVAQEVMGIKIYQLKYTAQIEFTDNCYWGDGGGPIGWQGGFTADRPSGSSISASIFDMAGHYKAGRKGQREQVSGTLTFQKTERGWNLAD